MVLNLESRVYEGYNSNKYHVIYVLCKPLFLRLAVSLKPYVNVLFILITLNDSNSTAFILIPERITIH